MTTTPRKPTVQPVCERVSVWHGYKQRSVRANDAPDLRERTVQVLEVLKAVVRDEARTAESGDASDFLNWRVNITSKDGHC